MALKEIFHTVASNLDCDAEDTDVIPSGRLVILDANARVHLPIVTGDTCIGIAGDTRATAFSTTVRNPESSALTIGAHHTVTSGSTRWTQNRVSDSYNETLASGQMTVYHGAGEFWTDQYASETAAGAAITWTPGDRLTNAITTNNAVPSGSWTNEAVGATVGSSYYGLLLGTPQALPSGVPGTDVEGSISFGTFIRLALATF